MYRELDDNELLYMINENDDNYDYLFLKYKPIILNICKKYENTGKSLGYEIEDLLQIASIALVNAIRTYKEKKNVLFYTYMAKCVRNNLRNELRNQLTNKKAVLNIAIPYDIPFDASSKSLIETIPDKSSPDPYNYLLEKMEEVAYINFLTSLPIEIAASFEMKIQNIKERDIAKFLDVDIKTIRKYLRDAKKAFEQAYLEFQAL